MATRVWLMALAFFGLWVIWIDAQDIRSAGLTGDFVAGLTAEQSETRQNAYTSLARARDETVSALLGIVRDKSANEAERLRPHGSPLELSVRLLGEFRATEAVKDLVAIIDFCPIEKETLPPEQRYPAVQALISIGKPCIPVVIDAIAQGSNGLRTSLSVRVIKGIEGLEVGRIVLENAVEGETNATRRTNLREALVLLNQLGGN